MNSSSALLYKLTNKRAYFHEVTIILPSTWSYKQEYKKVPEGDYFPTANVRVASPHPSYNHTPYTFQPGRCGELGRYIHFTPEFILNYPPDGTYCKNCDELAKVFVHEWLHLRYGVFDEYGSSDNPNYSMFYLKYGSWVSREASKTTDYLHLLPT